MKLLDAPPDRVFEQSDDEHQDNDHGVAPEEQKDPAKDTVMQVSRLFLRNLVFSCTEVELMKLFQPFGKVAQVSFFLAPRLILHPPISFLDDKINRDIRSFMDMLILWEPIVEILL